MELLSGECHRTSSGSIGSGNALVPSDNKPLSELKLPRFMSLCGVTMSQWVNFAFSSRTGYNLYPNWSIMSRVLQTKPVNHLWCNELYMTYKIHKQNHDWHDDVIKWKHFPRYWPFVWGIYRSPVNSPHKGQWRGALMFPLICARINGRVNHREAGDLRRHHAHYVAIVLVKTVTKPIPIDLPKFIHVQIVRNNYRTCQELTLFIRH